MFFNIKKKYNKINWKIFWKQFSDNFGKNYIIIFNILFIFEKSFQNIKKIFKIFLFLFNSKLQMKTVDGIQNENKKIIFQQICATKICRQYAKISLQLGRNACQRHSLTSIETRARCTEQQSQWSAPTKSLVKTSASQQMLCTSQMRIVMQGATTKKN